MKTVEVIHYSQDGQESENSKEDEYKEKRFKKKLFDKLKKGKIQFLYMEIK